MTVRPPRPVILERGLGSGASLAVLVGALLSFCLAWGALVLAWAHPDPVPWAHLERLPGPVQNAYTIGIYLGAPAIVAWYWRCFERRGWGELGLSFRPRALLHGLGLGVSGIAVSYAVTVGAGWVHFRPPVGLSALHVLVALVAAAGMGLLEEVLFRGVVLRTLARDRAPAAAVVLSALVFALAHFLRPNMTWLGAITCFVGVFATGLVLTYGAWLEGLWFSAGLHGPWIFFISLSSQFNLWDYAPWAWLLTGSGYPPRGLVTIATMIALAIGLWWPRRKRAAA